MFESLGEQLKRERIAHKYTQTEIAEFLGVSKTMVQHYENDRNPINDNRLKALESKYQCTFNRYTPQQAKELNEASTFKERMAVKEAHEKDFSELVNEQIEKEKETFRLTTNRLKMRLKEETETKESAENEVSKLKKQLQEVQKTNKKLWEENAELRKKLQDIERTSKNSADLIVELARYKNAFAKMALEKMEAK